MMSASQTEASSPNAFVVKPEIAVKPGLIRRAAISQEPTVLADIYQDETNIVIWQRELASALQQVVDEFVTSNRTFQAAMTVTPQNALARVSELLGTSVCHSILSENIAELVDMFCYLFELKRTGLRLTVLDRAMCPKVPCRLVTTYRGLATEWLAHNVVDRTKLGAGSHGVSDEESGLFPCKGDLHQLSSGDIALLKGELWEGNENAGLVHRSPALSENESRLLLTLDFTQ